MGSIVGRITEIWRYAVKSMGGEQLDHCVIGPRGIPGDRAWAIRDEAAGAIRGAKKIPALLQFHARYLEDPSTRGRGASQLYDRDVPPVEITLPGGTRVRSDDHDIDARLSEVLGRQVTLWPLQPPENTQHYRLGTFDSPDLETELRGIFGRLPDEPLPDLSGIPQELFQYVAPLGTYFDAFPLHLLTVATLRELGRLNPSTRADRRRFRPNVLIEMEGEPTGLLENEWIGRTLRVGTTEVQVEMPTMRCVMPTLPQADLPKDPSILRTIVRETGQNLGVYASVVTAGEIKVGDPVELV